MVRPPLCLFLLTVAQYSNGGTGARPAVRKMLVLLTGWFVRRGLGGRRGPWNSPGQHLMLSIVAEGGAAVFASLCTILYRVWHHGGGHLHLRWHPAGVGTICSYIYTVHPSHSARLSPEARRESTPDSIQNRPIANTVPYTVQSVECTQIYLTTSTNFSQ